AARWIARIAIVDETPAHHCPSHGSRIVDCDERGDVIPDLTSLCLSPVHEGRSDPAGLARPNALRRPTRGAVDPLRSSRLDLALTDPTACVLARLQNHRRKRPALSIGGPSGLTDVPCVWGRTEY